MLQTVDWVVDRSVRNGMYGDGVVYTHKGGWVPTYELELKEGEVHQQHLIQVYG